MDLTQPENQAIDRGLDKVCIASHSRVPTDS